MRLLFSHKVGPKVPAKLVADVVIAFEGDPHLEGMTLVGCSIWQGAKGPYVSLPARPAGGGKYFDLLRYEGDPLTAQVLKANILASYEDALAAGDVQTVAVGTFTPAEATV